VTDGQISLLISGFAFAISVSGFVWSIWKEFIYVKPRVQVSFQIMEVFASVTDVKELCVLTATNMGPGSAILYCCLARGRLNWRRRPTSVGLLNPIEGNPMVLPHRGIGPFADGLPFELTPGKSKSFYFPYVADCFLDQPLVRVGVQDTYGRNHWCRRTNVLTARDRYRKDFPKDDKK
jgi:hypothetical protein